MKRFIAGSILAAALAVSTVLQGQETAPPTNDAVERAEVVSLTTPLTATFVKSDNGYAVQRFYAFDLDAAGGDTKYDIVVANPAKSRMNMALIDEKGGTITRALRNDDTGELRLKSFVLGPGRHFLLLEESLEENEALPSFTLSFENKGPWSAGEEREPNDEFRLETVGPIAQGMKGELIDGEDRDFFALDVTGPLQLWRITATGPNVKGLVLVDAQGSDQNRAEVTADQGAEMWSVLLPPGKAHFRISGEPGPWEVKALPQGPAPLEVMGGNAAPRKDGETDEVEPNNGVDRALILPIDGSRAGQIEQQGDDDYYRFTLDGETRVHLDLSGPTDIRLRASMMRVDSSWDAGTLWVVAPKVAEGETPVATSSAGADFLLPQGDYYIKVSGDKRSKTPYVLALKRLPSFGPETDLEPNEDVVDASYVPPSLHITGQASGDDRDWYHLPDLDRPATLTVTVNGTVPDGLSLYLGHLKLTQYANGPQKAEIDNSDGLFKQSEDNKSFTIDVPAGKDQFLRVMANAYAAYDLTLSYSDGPKAVAPADVTASLKLEAASLAAFADVTQVVKGTLSVRNGGSAAADLPLTFRLSDDRWAIEGAPASVHVEAGASAEVPFTLAAPPMLFDGRAVIVGAKAGDGIAETTMGVSADAAMVAPERRWALPASMLGGIDVAWSALGGTTTAETYKALIDGWATSGTAERIDGSDEPGSDVVLDLAGETPWKLTGIIVNTTIGPDLNNQVRRIAIETSVDGQTYTRALEADIPPRQAEYPLPFASPIEAKFVKVLALQTWGLSYSVAMIGEVRVVAEPAAATALAPQGFNIGDPKLGGTMVSFHPISGDAYKMLSGDGGSSAYIAKDDKREIDWTVAFRNLRAARVASIGWSEKEPPEAQYAIDHVRIETAMEANGPFTQVGVWDIVRAADGSVAPYVLPSPVWARFVRFSVVVPPYSEEQGAHANYFRMPTQLTVMEAPADAANRTIIGEWGETTMDGPYEVLNPRPLPPGTAAVAAGGNDKASARALPLDQPQAGRASAGTRVEWWAIDVPAEGQSLTLTLGGTPNVSVVAALEDSSGKAVPLIVGQDDGKTRIATAKVAPGRYYVKVEEPPRSIAIAWDTSGSVGPYVPTIAQSIRGFARYLTPGRDEVQLLPFADPEALPILKDWSGDPLSVFSTLASYDWHDQSSNAEGGALGALRVLDGRPGSRAVILITDYATNGSMDQRMESLDLIKKVGARIFNFAIPSGSDAEGAAVERGIFYDYAAASNGTAAYAGTPAELEQAFARTAAALRAPKDYTIAAAVGFKPPEPGLVKVEVPADAVEAPASKDRAVLVILDASGSMLKKLGKKRRIEIAKDTLNELTQKMLPEGTPFAMRVFGDTKPDSCETNLRQPLSPLNRAAVKGVVDKIISVNKAKTAIGASLTLAAEDLAGAAGQKIIILITDGEETCDGDPAQAIEDLKAKGIDARISIVGFAVDDAALKDTFTAWAAAGGGGYFDATKPEELAPAVRKALLPPFEVVAADGSVVATGAAGGDPIEVPPGTYTIRVLTDPPKEFPGIVVESGGTASVTLTP